MARRTMLEEELGVDLSTKFEPATPEEVSTRLCLMCRKPFLSLGYGNRRCGKCEEKVSKLALSKAEANGGRSARNYSGSSKLVAEENITNTQ